jgi:thiol-disulfide isomerase/thioredoxin
MRIVISLIITFSLFTSMQAQNDSIAVITGKFSEAVLESEYFGNWLKLVPKTPLNEDTLEALAKVSKEDLEFVVYLGTWCEDSQTHVPMLFELMQKLNWTCTWIGVNRDKECPFEKKECKTWDIQYVPTLVIKRQGVELGRIVEQPGTTWENDLLKLLK